MGVVTANDRIGKIEVFEFGLQLARKSSALRRALPILLLQAEPWTGLGGVDRVDFMLPTFDIYFGMLNLYRIALSWNIGDDDKGPGLPTAEGIHGSGPEDQAE